MTSLPQFKPPDVKKPEIKAPKADLAALGKGGFTASLWFRILVLLLILLLVLLILLVSVPALRERTVEPWLARTGIQLPFLAQQVADDPPPAEQLAGDVDIAAADPTPTLIPTVTPHPATELHFAVDETPGRVRWQIAYPGAERNPGEGCAYLSFWLTGPDAEAFTVLDTLDAELVIYDGEFIFERYGPTSLESLRSLGEPRYHELPAGAPVCQRHRLAETAEYAGMEFRLSLLANDLPVRVYRGVLQPEALTFATVTPTPTPPGPTPTPYPQVQVQQQVNVRSGPGTNYPILGAANPGSIYPVLAVNPQRDWWQIDFLDQRGWIYTGVVQAVAVDAVAVTQDIPPTPIPVPTATPVPPTATPSPVPTPYLPFLLTSNGTCEPNAAMTYFEGKVVNPAGAPVNGVCVHVAYEGPRNTKCTGCDGAAAGKWGFAPFGNLPGKQVTVRIYVVPCPESMPSGGQNPTTGFASLVPVSPVWTYTIGESVQCTNITFSDNRYFDDKGNQIPPPTPTSPTSANEIQRFTGNGQGFNQVSLDAGPLLFRMNHTGSGTFSVRLLTSTGQAVDQLVDTTGTFDGSKRVEIPSKGLYLVAVTAADGAWTVVIERP